MEDNVYKSYIPKWVKIQCTQKCSITQQKQIERI